MLSSHARPARGAHLRRAPVLALALALAVALAASPLGCADPQGEFDAFGERVRKADGTSSGGGAGGGGECELPAADAITGQYLVALSAKIARTKPIVFLAHVNAVEQGGQLMLSLDVQPLASADRKTPVGAPSGPLGPFPVEPDGSFTLDLGKVSVSGEANPITCSDIEADADMIGRICQPADFFCGEVTGVAKASIELQLDGGSTFTFQRVTDAASLPDPVVGCDKKAAAEPVDCSPT